MLAQVFVANLLFNRFLWTLRVALEFAPPLVNPSGRCADRFQMFV